MILSGPLLTHFYQTKYLLQLDQEHLLASPSPGYAHLTFPGSSHAIETNSLFLPVFQISSIFTVVGIQCYSHYKYATCLTRVFFLSCHTAETCWKCAWFFNTYKLPTSHISQKSEQLSALYTGDKFLLSCNNSIWCMSQYSLLFDHCHRLQLTPYKIHLCGLN